MKRNGIMKRRLGAVKRRLSFRYMMYDAVAYFFGSLLYALSVDMFTAPNDIAPGGVTGVATILHTLYALPIGITTIIINVPLFILGIIFIGWRYIGRTALCLAMSSAAIDAMSMSLPEYKGDILLASLFGGVISGIGLGLIIMRGGSTGGTDIIARLLAKPFPFITQGNLIMLVDFAVIVAAGIVYGLEGALYSLTALFVSSFMIDKLVYGAENGKFMLIVSDKSSAISMAINEKIERGTTLLKGKGGYSGGEHEIVLCAIRRSEVHKINSLIRSIDRRAFIIIGEAGEILGDGFKAIDKNEFGEIAK